MFLHGVGGNRLNWHGQLAAFAPLATAVAWDARGYLGSEDYDGPFDFEEVAADAVRMMDAFGAERAHICGLSMGGRIALEIVSRHPERVASLALCDTQAGFADLPPAEKEAFLESRRGAVLSGKPLNEMARAVAPGLIGSMAEPGAVETMIASMSALRPANYVKALESLVLTEAIPDPGAVQIPVRVIVGSEDRLTPPKVARELAALLPTADLVEIEGAGHLPNLERPAAFNAVLREFLCGRAGLQLVSG